MITFFSDGKIEVSVLGRLGGGIGNNTLDGVVERMGNVIWSDPVSVIKLGLSLSESTTGNTTGHGNCACFAHGFLIGTVCRHGESAQLP